MLKAEIKGKFRPPKIDLSKELRLISDRIIIPDIQGRMAEGRDISGKKYDPLAKSTIKRKGHAVPLLGKDQLLRNSIKRFKAAKDRVLIRIKSGRRDVARYLQVEGVRSKRFGKRRFDFFGISQKAEKEALETVFFAIRKIIRNAR